MKKCFCLLLAGVLLLSVTACKKQAGPAGNTENATQQATGSTQTTEQQETVTLALPSFVPSSGRTTKAVDKTAFQEPIVIPLSQGSIAVNPPIFTGIPVTALYNQNAYRFRDGVATVTVEALEGIRNLQIDQAGKLVGNTDYRAPAQEDTLQVRPADIGAEYYAGDGLYAYTDGTLATEGNLPYGVEYLYGLKNEKGQVVAQVQYCGIPAITFRDGYAMVRKPDGTHVMLSKTGHEYGSFTGGHSNGWGTAVVATGETNHLYDLEGRRISDGYDAIGFVYNGLAPVEKDNKIGFIDAYGKELLPPTIAFDTVIFNGKENAEFTVTFADEDAFLLPIGGELAVITLDRTGWVQKNRAEDAYKAFLTGKLGAMTADGGHFVQDYGYRGNGINAYAYHDVSGDGIPELFLQSEYTTILSYQQDTLVEWHTSGSSQPVYLLEDGGILAVHHSTGCQYRYLTFDADGIEADISFFEPAGQPTEIWYFQDEKVSETQYAELTKPYLSQKQTRPDWQRWYGRELAELPESYQQVLNNEKNILVLGEPMTLTRYLSRVPGSGNQDIAIGQIATANGQKMLAVKSSEEILVLFEADGIVYGGRYSVRAMYRLDTNGVYYWNDNSDGLSYGANRLRFQKGDFADEKLYQIDQKDDSSIQYTVGGKAVTKAEADAYARTIEADEVTWTVLFGYTGIM